ncbi:DEAD/DEAH box helicase [Ruminococcus sp.]|uniref:DEAD/DEAH box helicase n=1 Tax=Ruminococcus sp. TaxID=41978 RepID=UPI001B57C18F|nr:DEAD/DEAH box helicase [Ruminococcus sp.]MBP5431582.1 DEAD/DEAH box helicase [Ruminococcus sp.]
MQLRPYQQELIDNIRRSVRSGHRSIVSVLGCGGGKSVIQAEISRSATDKGNTVLFLVHRKELCEQIANTFAAQGVDMSLCSVSMVQTVSRHIEKIQRPQLIITDEAHHSTANSYKKIYEAFPNALRLGFTATPCRLNHGGLGEVYEDLITSVSTKWLIENNYLSPYKYYSVKLADTSGLHVKAGDYKADEVAELMQNKEIYGSTVDQWEKLAKGKKTIVYCASVEASKMTAMEFNRAGYISYSLDGATDKNERQSVMERFRNGEIKVLCNCDLFGEGLDVPDCECTVLLRPTQSLTLYIQQSMRSMRYMPGKTAIIIDHVGNCYLHGLPDDDREWTLEPKKKQENMVKIRECPMCYAVYSPTEQKCPYCGYAAVKEIQRKEKQVVEIDLVEMKRQDDIRNTKLADAELETWAEIVEFQKLHKYKFAWCIRYAALHDIPIPSKYNTMRRIIGV